MQTFRLHYAEDSESRSSGCANHCELRRPLCICGLHGVARECALTVAAVTAEVSDRIARVFADRVQLLRETRTGQEREEDRRPEC